MGSKDAPYEADQSPSLSKRLYFAHYWAEHLLCPASHAIHIGRDRSNIV